MRSRQYSQDLPVRMFLQKNGAAIHNGGVLWKNETQKSFLPMSGWVGSMLATVRQRSFCVEMES
jgi:hypothetical protein